MNNVKFPRFDDFLAPILRLSKDEKEHGLSDTINAMSSEFGLNEEQKNALLPNGKRTYIYDRVAWAITYLVQSGLLVRTGRSKYKITDRGMLELTILPDTIRYTYLEKFPSYVEFKELRHPKKQEESDSSSMTPDEELDALFERKDNIIARNLLSSISSIKPSDFERLIIDLVLALGYGKNHEEMAKVL